MAPTYSYGATVLRVIDGDTLLCNVDLGFKLRWEHPVRLWGIDAPELGTETGAKAKAFVENLKLTDVTLLSCKPDKYGRVLADVLLPDGRRLTQLVQAFVDSLAKAELSHKHISTSKAV